MVSWGYEEIKAIKQSGNAEYKPNRISLSLFYNFTLDGGLCPAGLYSFTVGQLLSGRALVDALRPYAVPHSLYNSLPHPFCTQIPD